MTSLRVVTALALCLLTAGCGKEVVVGGQKDVDARATGDGTPEGGAAPARGPSYSVAFGEGGPLLQAGRAQGTVTFDARVTVRDAAGQSSPLNLAPATATVRIDGRDTATVASRTVVAARYTTVRVAFTRVTANVTSGLVIGGASLLGEVNVAIAPGDSIVVEQAVDLGGTTEDATVLIDLDASAWLGAANPATRLVAATTFRNAVKLRAL